MRYRRSRRLRKSKPEINLNSCLDLFLNILLFFVFATEIANVDAIDIQVPSSSYAKAQPQSNQKLVLFITKDNQYVGDNGKLTLSELPQWLRAQKQKGTDSIVVRGDQVSNLQAFVDALGACKEAGFEKVKVETQQPDAGKPN